MGKRSLTKAQRIDRGKEQISQMEETYPHLAKAAATFQHYGFEPEDIYALIKYNHSKGEAPQPFNKIRDEATRDALVDLSEQIYKGYKPYAKRKESGLEPLYKLESDIGKIFSVRGDAHYHGAKKAIESRLDFHVRKVGEQVAELEAQFEQPAYERPRNEDMRSEGMSGGYKAAATASAIVAAGSAAGAAKNWANRTKEPKARNKAVTFAVVTAVAAVALGAAVMLGRKGSLSGNQVNR